MEGKKYQVRIYPRAQNDLDEISDYMSNTLCNPDAFEKFSSKMLQLLDLASSNPYMYPLIQNPRVKNKALRKIIVGKYIVFYQPMDIEHEIHVLRIMHGTRNFDWAL